jgi:group I intron endonuclease
MAGGVYEIVNTVNGHRYVGSSANIPHRWSGHKYDLNKNKHHSIYLQRAWDKYGTDCFKFSVIEYCEKEQLIEREQFHIDALKPSYNISPTAKNSLGVKHTPEFCAKMSKIKMGNTYAVKYMRSAEARAKFSAIHKGKIVSEETRAKISLVQIGHIASDETRTKMRASSKHLTLSNEHYAKLSALFSGKPLPEETKRKLSVAHIGNISALGHKVSDNARERISMSLKQYYQKQKEGAI